MTQVYGALLLLIVYLGIAVAVLLFSHDLGVALFSRYCEAANLASTPCQTAAMTVAAQALVAILLVVVVTIGFTQKSLDNGAPPPRIEAFATSRGMMLALLAAIAATLILHYLRHKPVGYRPEESVFVSLESLAWPLLLQLAFWTRQIPWKCTLVVFLAGVVSISPFRDTLFAIAYFGVLVPFGGMLLTGRFLSRRGRIFGLAAAGGIVVLISMFVFFETGSRPGTNAVAAYTPGGAIGRELEFRAFVPFFGAVFLDNLIQSRQPLPGFIMTVERKFRLASVNLNEFAYKALYGSDSPYQETPLFYGESLANTGISPFFWEFAAPLALVLAYFVLRPLCDVGVLIAVALWRGSMGGLFDIVAALVLQVTFCLILSYLQNRSRKQLATGTQQNEMA